VKGFRLLPKRHEFYEFFTSAAENAKLAAQALLRMANSLDQSEEFAKEIRRLEHEGDVITHRCVQVLNKTFMTPIDREDIHNLASAMDDIVDFIEAVSERLWLYKLSGRNAPLIDLAATLEESTREVATALSWLSDPHKRQDIFKTLEKIHTLENRGDEVLRSALASLFDDTPDPIQVIKWKEIYETAEIAIDKCETVANVIEGILVKYG
jgi:predicted phosphate transport protein (TIGR00153 family)